MSTAVAFRLDDVVRAVNREEYPLVVKWNSRKFTLQPDKEMFIPAACAFCWFGDPRASSVYQSILGEDGTRMFVNDRLTEVRRLRIKWGAPIEGDERTFDGVPVPNVEIWTQDGERVVTVIDDPEGKNVISASPSVSDDEGLRELVRKQQRDLEMLKARLDMEDEATAAAANEGELPQDLAETFQLSE